MMQDVLIGTIKDYAWDHIKTFIVSVERSGYAGDKVMFVENIQHDARHGLEKFGWELIETVSDKAQSYATARHIPVVDHLRTHSYRYVLYIDVRDAVLQSNPILWLEQHLAPAEIIGPSECLRIRDESTNTEWLRRTMGPGVATWLGDQDICCCGTIVGTGETVTKMVAGMCKLAEGINGWGLDQAYFNYLLRVPPFRDLARIPKMSEGFIATCSWFLSGPERFIGLLTDERPNFDWDSATVCAPGTTVPFCILHQYDRDGGWDRLIKEKYA